MVTKRLPSVWTSPFASLLAFAREHRWREILFYCGRYFANDRELVDAVRSGATLSVAHAKKIAARDAEQWRTSRHRKALVALFDSLHAVEAALRNARRKVDAAVASYGPPPSFEEITIGTAWAERAKRIVPAVKSRIQRDPQFRERVVRDFGWNGWTSDGLTDGQAAFLALLEAQRIVARIRPSLRRTEEDERHSKGLPRALLVLSPVENEQNAVALAASEREPLANFLDAELARFKRRMESEFMVPVMWDAIVSLESPTKKGGRPSALVASWIAFLLQDAAQPPLTDEVAAAFLADRGITVTPRTIKAWRLARAAGGQKPHPRVTDR